MGFQSLEDKFRVELQALYKKGLEEPLATDDEGPTQLLPHLVAALEDIVDGIGPLVEGEARALSSSALTRVFNHLISVILTPTFTSCSSPWMMSAAPLPKP